MCDTVVVVKPDRVLFAKNSDRDPNEGQILEWHPRENHLKAESLRCTWIEIPQVEETFAILLSRPFWMWGAEIGSNEHGVTIGNEAVFTRHRVAKTGLLGMDLLRLGLERARTAREAVDVMVELLEVHGQGGGCGHENRGFRYHNSFLVADPQEAFVFETADRDHAVESITGARSISNGLTLEGFARQHADPVRGSVASCATRQSRTQFLAGKATGAGDLMALLRDHGEGVDDPSYTWWNGGMGAPCMHAGGVLAASQTTASWVSELTPRAPRHWVTGTAAPCTSLFKPVAVEGPLDLGPGPGEAGRDACLWWRHERLHRRVLQDPSRLMPVFVPERDRIEAGWLADPPKPDQAFAEGERLLSGWTRQIEAVSVEDKRPSWVRRYWRVRNAPEFVSSTLLAGEV